ncbi:DNA mismatch repair protein Msh2 [Hondaea fermentalgiana]|uniref:DNA mismatch repair protein Msh2 n=1 Tax=Hondaea fermentalgiana TaxID=2315210 RepID=A0A2R5GR58_9STRA|nr:DNA mismatch repair protein Msh2 [Hondaea fermentalgiana]|eukprot:GBG31113.1 DNA mismatch repair protein Msh2 [Hondaea fermentalgiana]
MADLAEEMSSGGGGGDGLAMEGCTVVIVAGPPTKTSAVRLGVAVHEERARSDLDDKKRGKVTVYEFEDCDALTNLESLLVGLGGATGIQSVYHSGDESVEKLVGEKGLGIACAETVGGKDLATTSMAQDVETLTGAEGSTGRAVLRSFEGGDGLGMRALAGVIRKSGLLEDEDARGTIELEQGRLNQYMRLDAAAVEALNLFPATSTRDGRAVVQEKAASVFGVLNHCTTKEIGARLLRRWIRQPLLDAAEIRKRQNLVFALKEDDTRRAEIRQQLRQVPDIARLTRRLRGERPRGGLKEMYVLYEFARRLPNLADVLREDSAGDTPACAALVALGDQVHALGSKNRFGKYLELVEGVLDMEYAPAEFRVQSQHDETGELANLYEKLTKIQHSVEDARQELEDGTLSAMAPRFETDAAMLRTYGFHFRINKKHDNDLKKVKGDAKYLSVVSAGIRWTTQGLQTLSERHTDTLGRIEAAQLKLVQQAAQVAATFEPLFEAASSLAAQLDVLASLAHAAAFAPATYVQPELVGLDADAKTRRIQVEAARHPCLEHLEGVDFIANDYRLGSAAGDADEGRFQIITGPNMGGKSTYIRQLGTLLVMAQMGSFVPAEAATLPIVDAVLARVGASDEQLRGVSTFMAEMLDAAAIVKTATADSLVIIDELGRGTSTYDGFGLAWAISRHLATSVGCFCLFATHFHELTVLANEVEKGLVSNKHVAAHATDDAITMLYNVNKGPCQESFGINIASMAGFPPDVIASAKRKADQLERLNTSTSSDTREAEDQALQKVLKFAKLSKTDACDIAKVRALLAA